mmetsp:Transcript_11521/g.31905  ORF Transcript_11521/g.31905 Transcript_11521/m.31905 type:complete len:195 (-) Transcript_11521:1374-1958(-)
MPLDCCFLTSCFAAPCCGCCGGGAPAIPCFGCCCCGGEQACVLPCCCGGGGGHCGIPCVPCLSCLVWPDAHPPPRDGRQHQQRYNNNNNNNSSRQENDAVVERSTRSNPHDEDDDDHHNHEPETTTTTTTTKTDLRGQMQRLRARFKLLTVQLGTPQFSLQQVMDEAATTTTLEINPEEEGTQNRGGGDTSADW